MPIKSDRVRQVETTKRRHGRSHYKKIGTKGGAVTPTKFTSETGRRAAMMRWAAVAAKNKVKEES